MKTLQQFNHRPLVLSSIHRTNDINVKRDVKCDGAFISVQYFKPFILKGSCHYYLVSFLKISKKNFAAVAAFHSRLNVSSLCRGHANLLCIVPILINVSTEVGHQMWELHVFISYPYFSETNFGTDLGQSRRAQP